MHSGDHWFTPLSARAFDNKLLVALNAISAQQAKAMVHTEQLVETLLNYLAMYPNDGIVYRASNMVLCTHADAGYLNEKVHTSTYWKTIQFHALMAWS